jgi:hypothetical protein
MPIERESRTEVFKEERSHCGKANNGIERGVEMETLEVNLLIPASNLERFSLT